MSADGAWIVEARKVMQKTPRQRRNLTYSPDKLKDGLITDTDKQSNEHVDQCESHMNVSVASENSESVNLTTSALLSTELSSVVDDTRFNCSQTSPDEFLVLRDHHNSAVATTSMTMDGSNHISKNQSGLGEPPCISRPDLLDLCEDDCAPSLTRVSLTVNGTTMQPECIQSAAHESSSSSNHIQCCVSSNPPNLMVQTANSTSPGLRSKHTRINGHHSPVCALDVKKVCIRNRNPILELVRTACEMQCSVAVSLGSVASRSPECNQIALDNFASADSRNVLDTPSKTIKENNGANKSNSLVSDSHIGEKTSVLLNHGRQDEESSGVVDLTCCTASGVLNDSHKTKQSPNGIIRSRKSDIEVGQNIRNNSIAIKTNTATGTVSVTNVGVNNIRTDTVGQSGTKTNGHQEIRPQSFAHTFENFIAGNLSADLNVVNNLPATPNSSKPSSACGISNKDIPVKVLCKTTNIQHVLEPDAVDSDVDMPTLEAEDFTAGELQKHGEAKHIESISDVSDVPVSVDNDHTPNIRRTTRGVKERACRVGVVIDKGSVNTKRVQRVKRIRNVSLQPDHAPESDVDMPSLEAECQNILGLPNALDPLQKEFPDNGEAVNNKDLKDKTLLNSKPKRRVGRKNSRSNDTCSVSPPMTKRSSNKSNCVVNSSEVPDIGLNLLTSAIGARYASLLEKSAQNESGLYSTVKATSHSFFSSAVDIPMVDSMSVDTSTQVNLGCCNCRCEKKLVTINVGTQADFSEFQLNSVPRHDISIVTVTGDAKKKEIESKERKKKR